MNKLKQLTKQLALLSLSLLTLALSAQSLKLLPQQKLSKWGIKPQNYSGLTPIGNNRYAVVSDQEPLDGFYIFRIEQDSITGKVTQVVDEGFFGNEAPKLDAWGSSARDLEGIALHLPDSLIYLSGEGDQEILAYDLQGKRVAKRLDIPPHFGIDKIVNNGGFESLSYCTSTQRFWTTTENALPADGIEAIRLQSFYNGKPTEAYAYPLDARRLSKKMKRYLCGVSDICALPNGDLLVLERELGVKKKYIGSKCSVNLYLVKPSQETPLPNNRPLKDAANDYFVKKHLLASFTTSITLLRLNLANYEGLSLGIRLKDGRQTLLLLNDSQAGEGKGAFHLKDYIKVGILND